MDTGFSAKRHSKTLKKTLLIFHIFSKKKKKKREDVMSASIAPRYPFQRSGLSLHILLL